MQKFACFLLIFTSLLFLAATVARGQTLSLGLWPPLLEVMIQPGKSITQVYKLSNSGETDLVFTSKIVPFEPANERGEIKLNESSLADWLKWFSFQNADLALKEKFILPAGKNQEIVLKIKIPEEAIEDDYYLTLLFEALPNVFLNQPGPPRGETSGQVEAKIGANILLTVSQTGEPPKKAQVEEFKLLNCSIIRRLNFCILDSFVTPQFLVRLKNTGKAFFKPVGAITVNGWLNQKWVLDLLPENILANSLRQINCQKNFSPNETNISPALCRLPAKFLLGRYKAKLEFEIDETDNKHQKELVFWAAPAKLILGILTAIVFLAIIRSRFKFPLDR